MIQTPWVTKRTVAAFVARLNGCTHEGIACRCLFPCPKCNLGATTNQGGLCSRGGSVYACGAQRQTFYEDEPGKKVPAAEASLAESAATSGAVFDQEIGAYVLDNSLVGSEVEAVDVEYLDIDEGDTTIATEDPPPGTLPVSRREFTAGIEASLASPDASSKPGASGTSASVSPDLATTATPNPTVAGSERGRPRTRTDFLHACLAANSFAQCAPLVPRKCSL